MKKNKHIDNHTFGCEFEFADGDKKKIKVPKGFKWTTNPFTTFHNSTGEKVGLKDQFGGELNTRPVLFNEENLTELQEVVKSIENSGGQILWDMNWHIHIDIHDLDLEQCKRLYTLIYIANTYMKKGFDLPMWYQTPYLAPSITPIEYNRCMRSKSLEEFDNSFVNGSDRGYIRHYISMAQRGRIGTVEFRLYSGTFDFERFKYCILFSYNFIQFALDHNIESLRNITYSDLEKHLPINKDLVPKTTYPLLWAAEHTNNVTVIGESYKKSNVLISKIAKVSQTFEKVILVNSFLTDIEQSVTNKEVKVYTKSLFTYLIYDIILNDRKVSLSAPYEWVELEKGDKEERLAKLFLFDYIKRCKGNSEYHKAQLKDYQENYTEHIIRAKGKSAKIIERIQAKNITVVYGDVVDAIEECKQDEKSILIYQSEFNTAFKSMDNALAFYTGLLKQEIFTDYSCVDLNEVNYLLISKMKYHNYTKILRDNRTYLYSNVDTHNLNKFSGRTIKPVLYKKIPDNHNITKDSQIKFIRASMSEIDYLRAIYMKKDIMLGSAPFNYLWFVDDYLIGACMFDFSKQAGSAGDKIWMKSDFVIDSKQDKLSKLLIMVVCSKEFKEELDVRYRTDTQIITTTVFTNNPVSMKYRGVFKLDKRESGKLYYEQQAGKYKSLKEVMVEYIKKRK